MVFGPKVNSATIELRIQSGHQLFHTDLFVEMDRTFKPSKNISKFERYDHLITGWARHKDRYAKYLNTLPLVHTRLFPAWDPANLPPSRSLPAGSC